jgi:hypothetical protein
MSLLVDKFQIIENHVDTITSEDLDSLINNYFENIFHSDEKVIHSDLIFQIFWFKKDFNYKSILINHLINFLKQKKTFVRNNIKKGNFELEHLIKLIQNYNDKIYKFSALLLKNNDLLKISSGQLFDMILSDPTIINFLKDELGNISSTNKNNYIELFKIISHISENNTDSKCYQWFLFLVSSCLEKSAEEIINNHYPVPEQYQNILNLISMFSYVNEITNFFTFVKTDIHIIYSNSINLLCNLIKNTFEKNNVKEIISVCKNNKQIIQKMLSIPNLNYNEKTIKDFLSKELIHFINSKLPTIDDNNISDFSCFLELISIFDDIFKNNYAKYLLNNKIADFFDNNKIQNILLDELHQQILSNNKDENPLLVQLINYCNYIKEKDTFIFKYNKKLIERVLYKPNIELEKLYYHFLLDKLNDKLLVKTNKIINDVEMTLKDRENYNKLLEQSDLEMIKKLYENVNIVTTSYNNWDVNQNEGIVTTEMTFNGTIEKCMKGYDSFYAKRYQNKRKLHWLPHFGEIVFDYVNKEFKMMPIQYMILEYVTETKLVNKKDLMEIKFLKGYSENFRQSLISSLIFGGILKMTQEQIELNTNIDSISYDYIHIFFSTSNYGSIWENKREEELILEREDILSANINHYAKIKPIEKNELFDVISKNLHVFTLDKDFYEKVITIMIDKDYIKVENNMVEKLLY